MLNQDRPQDLKVIRAFLDEVGYGYQSFRLIPETDTVVWPSFAQLQMALKPLNPFYRFLFSVLRQGHPAKEEYFEQFFPEVVFDALKSCGFLVSERPGEWRADGWGIAPIEGLYLCASLPPTYPTAATPKQPVYVGIESIWLVESLPANLRGQRVLDLCTGTGVQGLVCAARGATQVVGLDLAPDAVVAANFNAALNGLADRYSARQSNLFSALESSETFDVFVSNPPFMPVMEDVAYPICGAGGEDGTVVLRSIFGEFTDWLEDDGRAFVFCNVLGSQDSISINDEILGPLARNQRIRVRAYVNDKATIDDYASNSLAENLRYSCPELGADERSAKVARWLESMRDGGVFECIYSQILHMDRLNRRGELLAYPGYSQMLTDPLVQTLRRVEQVS